MLRPPGVPCFRCCSREEDSRALLHSLLLPLLGILLFLALIASAELGYRFGSARNPSPTRIIC